MSKKGREASGGTVRRYKKLRALASDGRTPENERKAAASAADAMLALSPELVDERCDSEVYWSRHKYKTWCERDTLVHCIEYLGLEPKEYRDKRKRGVLVETDAASHAAIEHMSDVAHREAKRILALTLAGFLQGAMPIASDSDEKSDSSLPPDEMAAAMAGYGAGMKNRPRRALTETTDGE